jgi:hypothetical protein
MGFEDEAIGGIAPVIGTAAVIGATEAVRKEAQVAGKAGRRRRRRMRR